MPGPTLDGFVRTAGPLAGPALTALATGLTEALVAIHGAGVVHRDLKPGNVLLGPDGPRVLDFGIASAADSTTLTRTGVAVGTPAFMSPEQTYGQHATAAADVFAWAVTVVFAGTGRPAFTGPNTDVVLFRIRNDPPDLSGVDAGLAHILRPALEKDPQARPTAQDLLGLLLGGAAGGTGDVTAVLSRAWPSLRLPAPAPGSDPGFGSAPGLAPTLRQPQPWMSPPPASTPQQSTPQQSWPQQSGPHWPSPSPSPSPSQPQPSAPTPQQSWPQQPGAWWPPTPPPSHPHGPGPAGGGPRPALVVGAVVLSVVVLAIVAAVAGRRGGEPSASTSVAASGAPGNPGAPGTAGSLPPPGSGTPPSRAADALSVPAAVVGRWEGVVSQPGATRDKYPTTLELRNGRIGEVVGSADYPTFPCSGSLTLVVGGDEPRVQERITDGISNCADEGEIRLYPQADGTLRWEYYYAPGNVFADSSRAAATAVLTRY